MSTEGRDPYLGLLGELRTAAREELGRPGFCLGKVVEASAASIRIQANGLELDENDILVSAELAPGYQERGALSLPVGGLAGPAVLSGAASCGAGAHTSFTITGLTAGSLTQSGTYTPAGRLTKGDMVLLLPSEDGQLYYLMGKVVRYGAFSTH